MPVTARKPAALLNGLLCAAFFAMAALMLPAAMSPAPAVAAITQMTVTPTTRTVRPEQPARITIVWSLRTDGGVTKTVETDDGEFLINGAPVRNIPALTPQTKNAAAPAAFFNFTFTETITVPMDLIRQAARNGEELSFSRTFTDDGFVTTTLRTVRLPIASGLGGPLSISRLRLGFPGNQTLCNATAGEDVTVRAFVEAEGSGMLRGSWQRRQNVADGRFITLRTVQIPVTAGRNLELISPPIPAGSGGRFDVRFRIDSPAPSFAEPVVTCVVAGSEAQMVKQIPSGTLAEIISPRDFMPLDADTSIAWKPVAGAKAYLIEILADKDGAPVAAQEVGAGETVNTLSALTLEKLDPKRRYMVRVMAY